MMSPAASHSPRVKLGLIAAAVCVGVCSPSRADTVVTTDGRTYHGQVIATGRERVFIRVRQDGAHRIVQVARDAVESITRGPVPSPASSPVRPTTSTAGDDEPGYYLLPIHGRIGDDVTAAGVKAVIADARRRRAAVLLLRFDSTGGSREEAEAVIAALQSTETLRRVACVRRALSWAAVVAMTCPVIVMEPNGLIGAASPGPPDVGAATLPSACRDAVQTAGHPVLLARAALDPAVALCVESRDGRPTVVEGSAGTALKAAGRPLRLYPTEAVACGLAKAVCERPHLVHEPLGLSAWRLIGTGHTVMAEQVKRRDRRRREDHLDAIEPELERIDGEMKEIEAALVALATQAKALDGEFKERAEAIQSEYRRAYAKAIEQADGNDSLQEALQRKARAIRDRKLQQLRAEYEPQVKKLRAQIDWYRTQQRELEVARARLLSGESR